MTYLPSLYPKAYVIYIEAETNGDGQYRAERETHTRLQDGRFSSPTRSGPADRERVGNLRQSDVAEVSKLVDAG